MAIIPATIDRAVSDIRKTNKANDLPTLEPGEGPFCTQRGPGPLERVEGVGRRETETHFEKAPNVFM
jgi:hypothetical protein